MLARFVLAVTLATSVLTAQPPRLRASRATIAGVVQFEKLVVDREGLRLERSDLVPAVGVSVQLVRDDTHAVIAEVTTDEKGYYAMRATSKSRVYVRALAQTKWARVLNHEKITYSIAAFEALELTAGDAYTINLTAVDDDRSAGPFNILDVITRANSFLRAHLGQQPLPQLLVQWDTEYIGGTKFTFRTVRQGDHSIPVYLAFINGNRPINSDEYDDTVILHEYAHLLETRFSAPITIGGHHTLQSELDPRNAWVEGWADYFSAAVTDSPVYIDSLSTGMAPDFKGVFTIDWEPNVLPGVPKGSSSEHTVASTLWDLASMPPGDHAADHLGLGFAPLCAVFRGGFRSTPFPDIISFSNTLMRQNPLLSWSAFLEGRGLLASPGNPPLLQNPFITTLPERMIRDGIADSRSGTATQPHQNSRLATAFYSFTSSRPRTHTITLKTTASDDPAHANLTLHLRTSTGQIADTTSQKGGVGKTQRLTCYLAPGSFILEVRSWNPAHCNLEETATCHQAAFTIERTTAPAPKVPNTTCPPL